MNSETDNNKHKVGKQPDTTGMPDLESEKSAEKRKIEKDKD